MVRETGGDGVHSRNVTVRFIDYDPANVDKNSFLAINQFRIDYIGRVGFVIPDVILFVNGIPLVIIECKSPSLAETDDGGFWKPIEAGINQLLRYSNRREEVELEEGVEHLFHWNQLMVLEYEVPVPPPRIKVREGDVDYVQDEDFIELEAAEKKAASPLVSTGNEPGQTKILRQVIRNEADYPEVNPLEKTLPTSAN